MRWPKAARTLAGRFVRREWERSSTGWWMRARMVAGCRRHGQEGSGRVRNRVRAPVNWASQGQRRGKCRVRRRAERVSRPAREKNRRRRVLVVTTCSPRPMRAVQRAGCEQSPGPPAKRRGGETAGREMVETHAVLEVANGILDLGVAAMVCLEIQGVAIPVGDEGVIAVGGQQGQLRARRGLTRRTMSRTGAAPGSLWKGV